MNAGMEQDHRSSTRRLNQTSSNPITSYLRPRIDATDSRQEPANDTASPTRPEDTTRQTPNPTPSIPTFTRTQYLLPGPRLYNEQAQEILPTEDLKFPKRIWHALLPTNAGDI